MIIEKLGARLTKREGFVASRLHLPQHENPDTDNKQERRPGDEHRPDVTARARVVFKLGNLGLPVSIFFLRLVVNRVLYLIAGEFNAQFLAACGRGILAPGIYQLIKQQRPGNNQ